MVRLYIRLPMPVYRGRLPGSILSRYLILTLFKQVNQVDQLRKNSKKAEELLLEMSKRKGFEAAFADPLFLTWPLARFGTLL